MRLHNPIFASESRTRMRSGRTAWLLFAYIMLITAIMAIYLSVTLNSINSQYSSAYRYERMSSVGVEGYLLLASLQFAVVLFVVPAQVSGAIAGERDRRTLDLLLCTRMKPMEVVLGKFLSAMAYVLLMVVCAMPLYAVMLLFGGIRFVDILQLFLYIMVCAMAAAAMGLYCSARSKSSTTATVVSYIAIFMFGVITTSASLAQAMSISASGVTNQTPWVLYSSPVMAFIELLAGQFNYMTGGSIVGSLFGINMTGSTSIIDVVPLWIGNMAILLAMSCLLLWLSARRISPGAVVRRRGGKRDSA